MCIRDRYRTVCQDQGHWEERPVQTACGSGCGIAMCGTAVGCGVSSACSTIASTNCGSCGSCGGCNQLPATPCSTNRVWVANQVQSQVPYTTYEQQQRQVPYTYNITKYRTETKTRTTQVARQVSEQVPYTYTVTVMKPQTQTRTVKVPRVVQEQKPYTCLLYTSPSPRDQRGSRMPSSA